MAQQMFPIPKQLAHFRPIFELLHSIPDEEFDCDPDLDPVESTLKSIYCGQDFSAAEECLERDCTELAKLCSKYGDDYLWLHFLNGFLNPTMLPDLCDGLADPSVAETPPLRIVVKLPKDFDSTDNFGSVAAKFGDVEIMMVPTAESVLDYKLSNLCGQNDPDVDQVLTAVDWGAVTGTKVARVYSTPTKQEYITYLLKVPGGAAVVEVDSPNSLFDATDLERCLPTITVKS